MTRVRPAMVAGSAAVASDATPMTRGLHSFPFQLNLSRVWHNKTPYTPYTPPNTPLTRATQPLRAPLISQTALQRSS